MKVSPAAMIIYCRGEHRSPVPTHIPAAKTFPQGRTEVAYAQDYRKF